MSYFSAQPGKRPADPRPDAPSPTPDVAPAAGHFEATAGARPAAAPPQELTPAPPAGAPHDLAPAGMAASAAVIHVTVTEAKATPDPSATLAAIDAALRRNSAHVTVNGLFDLS